MRLSTDSERDEEAARATLRAALDAGVNLLDTAAAYGLDDRDMHHNERLIAGVLAERDDDVTVVTKCGMRRPRGAWRPDGRRNQILKDAEQSRQALGVDRLDALLLHAPDPKTKLSTSLRALATLKEQGVADRVGLSNVTRSQLEEALDVVDISMVELAVSPFDETAVRGGVVELCFEMGIDVLAHSPLGGPKKHESLSANDELTWLAQSRSVTEQTIVLAWLYGLHPKLVPIPGARRPRTAEQAAMSATITLRDDEIALLDEAYAVGHLLRTERESRRPVAPSASVMVLVGIQGAGKTSATEALQEAGYHRLSRDERGGTLADLAQALGAELEEGAQKVLMDATYPRRDQRNLVIETAWAHGADVECLWLDTPLAEAQRNAVARLLDRYGTLPTPEELKQLAKSDPNAFGPSAQHRFIDTFEPPSLGEGFANVERRSFVRRSGPGQLPGTIVDMEALTEVSTRSRRIAALQSRGQPLLIIGWFPEAPERAASSFDDLELEAEMAFCPHPAGPPRCWCRKPYPGLVIPWMRSARIGSTTYFGTSSASRQLAQTIGADYRPAAELDDMT